MLPECNHKEEDMQAISEKILELEKEKLGLHSQLDMKQLQLWQNALEISAETLSKLSSISSDQNNQLQYLENFDSRLKSLESEVRRITLDIKGLPASITAIEKNVEQLRNLTERLVERLNSLTEEFIGEYVKGPTIKHTGCLYNSIHQLARHEKNDNFSGLLEEVRQLIEAQGARIIEPEQGEPLNAKEHRPIRKVLTPREELDMKVAEVFKPGLGLNGRVILHAVVAVFSYDKDIKGS